MDGLDYETLWEIANTCPRALRVYLCLVNDEAYNRPVHYKKDDIVNGKLIPWGQWLEDIRCLARLCMVEFFIDKNIITVSLLDDEDPNV